MHNESSTQHIDDEITLKDIIVNAGIYFKEILKFWWVVGLLAIPIAIYFGYKAYNDKPHYEAKLTYTLNDGSPGGGLSSLLGSFGLGGEGKLNMSQILEVAKSRTLTNKILFSTIALDSLGGKNDFVANHIITLYGLHKIWEESSPSLKDFTFKNAQIEKFGPLELAALKGIYGVLLKGVKDHPPLYAPSFTKESGILSIGANTLDEQLSIFITKRGFEEVRNYYFGAKTSSPDRSMKFVEAKKDSITGLLKAKQLQLARFNDSHRNLVDPNLLTEKKMMETEIQKLTLMYGEVTKNFELADFSLASSKPQIEIVDEPIPPLDAKQLSLIIEFIKGGLIGFLIAVTLIILRKIFRDAMAV
jgi:hypothetical protein